MTASPRALAQRLHHAYRGSGADLPFGDPRRAHPGVAMEGYFWRISDAERRRAFIALAGVNTGPDGPWATLGVASTAGHHTMIATPGSWADPHRLGVRAGRAAAGTTGAPHAEAEASFEGDEHRLAVELSPACRVDVTISDPLLWPRRRFGGSSVFGTVPHLNQYWHPWLLGGRATGTVTLDGQQWEFDDAQVYAEKNWGREGFPESWWWGQAQGFDDRNVCAAFAGGLVHAGPLRTTVTGLVVRLPSGEMLRLGDPVVSPVRADVAHDHWRLRGRGYGWRVEVDASAPLTDAHVLPVPIPSAGANLAGALEHLAGRLSVRVWRHGRLRYAGESELAGLEHGSLDLAAAELARRGARPGATSAPPRS